MIGSNKSETANINSKKSRFVVPARKREMIGIGGAMLVPTIVMGAIGQPVAATIGAFISALFLGIAIHLHSNEVRARKLARQNLGQ
jgi:hypothetical protein